jgi:hypothetical protein
MATLVKNLSSIDLNSLNSLSNNYYLYTTDISTGRDSKVRLTDVIKSYRTLGRGVSMIQEQSVASVTLRSILGSGNVINVAEQSGSISISLSESQLDLNKCSNTNSLFLKTVDLASNVGATILPAANGGTNKSTAWVVGDIAYASATDTLGAITAASTGNVLLSAGTGTIPTYGKVALTTHVSGTLPVANGGSGLTSATSKTILIGNGTSSLTPSNVPGAGQILIGHATGNPAFANLASSDSSVIITNGNNTIDLASRATKLELSDGTDMLVSASTNTATATGKTFSYQKRIIELEAATRVITAGESGSIFTLSRAAGMAITLPSAVAGYTFEFHILTTFTGTCTITAASSADTYTGAVISHDKDEKGSLVALNEGILTSGWNIPDLADYILTLNADTDGRYLGGHLKFTALSSSKWHIEGTLFNDGSVSHIFS